VTQNHFGKDSSCNNSQVVGPVDQEAVDLRNNARDNINSVSPGLFCFLKSEGIVDAQGVLMIRNE
jgi:hypothetical protein